MTLVDELTDQVPLSDVRGLVGHDAGQFVLVSRRQNQAALDGNEAAGHCERVDDGVLQDEIIEVMLSFLGVARQAVADFLDVILDFRVFEYDPGLPHAAEPAQARAIFIFERDRGGRGAPQVRQVLIDGARSLSQSAAQPTPTLAATAAAARNAVRDFNNDIRPP